MPEPLKERIEALASRIAGPATRRLARNVAMLCGVVALVWVAYLHGIRTGEQRVASPPPAPIPPAPEAPAPEAPAPASTTPSEGIPEVWTRMAGLNVWIAGRREARNGGETRIVIMLHGYGKPREALLMIAEREAARFGTVFVFPEAPVALDWRRRGWWRSRRLNGEPNKDQEGLVRARKQVLELVAEARQRFSVHASEIVLAGFSQGATLALDVALHSEAPLGGLALLSPGLHPTHGRTLELSHLSGVPILLAHGRRDAVVPFAASDKLRRTMIAAGLDVTWVPYDGGHVVSWTTQRQLSKFITRVIAPE